MYSMCPSWRSTLTVRHYVNADHVGSVWRCRRSPLGARGRSGQEPTGAKQRCLADASLPFTVPLAGGRVVSPTVSLDLPSLCCEAQASPKVPTHIVPLRTSPKRDRKMTVSLPQAPPTGTGTGTDSPSQPTSRPLDCLSCRIIGTGALGATGLYAINQARAHQPGSVIGKRIMAGVGVLFLFGSVARWRT